MKKYLIHAFIYSFIQLTIQLINSQIMMTIGDLDIKTYNLMLSKIYH